MRVMITWLKKDGTCRSWTNASPEEHVCMSAATWEDALQRICEIWHTTPREAEKKISKSISKLEVKSLQIKSQAEINEL